MYFGQHHGQAFSLLQPLLHSLSCCPQRRRKLLPLLLSDVDHIGHLVVLCGFVGKRVPVLSRRLGSSVPGVVDGVGG